MYSPKPHFHVDEEEEIKEKIVIDKMKLLSLRI